MPPMLKDDDIGTDSDEERFEAVTPEHNVENLDGETNLVTAVEKRSHILEDVDGELEMEDVAPTCEVEISSTSNIAATDSAQMSRHQSDNRYVLPFGPQQPKDTHLISASLPRSPVPPPPPPPPPLPPSAFPPAVLDSVSNGPDPKLYPSSQVLFCSVFHIPLLFNHFHLRDIFSLYFLPVHSGTHCEAVSFAKSQAKNFECCASP